MAANFYDLTPDAVCNAIELYGLQPTGELIQLNSYENRVFSVTLEAKNKQQGDKVIVKFYRPKRWSKEAIQDEHDFLNELKAEDFPVATPILSQSGVSVEKFQGMWMTVFNRVRGRMPDELLVDDFYSIGRRLAQLHMIGARKPAKHRWHLSAEQVGFPALKTVEEKLAPEVKHRYLDAAEKILDYLVDHLRPDQFIRIHGDCHRGNLMHDGNQFFFVDFDDSCNGPVAQDVWLLLSAAGPECDEETDAFLEGYRELKDFDDDELYLLEPLRGLRIIYYANWIINRWTDPSFPRLFPEFGTYRYWAEETEAIEKIAWKLE